MDHNELELQIKKLGFPSSFYSLNGNCNVGGGFVFDHYSISHWRVYHQDEKGERYKEQEFETEDEACRYMLSLISYSYYMKKQPEPQIHRYPDEKVAKLIYSENYIPETLKDQQLKILYILNVFITAKRSIDFHSGKFYLYNCDSQNATEVYDKILKFSDGDCCIHSVAEVEEVLDLGFNLGIFARRKKTIKEEANRYRLANKFYM